MSSAAANTPARLSPMATEADLLALPEEGQGWELIDGELVQKEGGAHHSRAQNKLGSRVEPFDRRKGGGDAPGGWWILTEQLVRFGVHTLRPDLAGWLRERMPRLPRLEEDAVLDLRPDWICEIISPRKAAHDLVKKKRIYHQHEVPHYWIIDPRDETLTVHRWSAAGYVQVLLAQRGERVRAEPFELVELAVAELFDDEEEAR
jgi:Uma2 family endonuclease